MKDISRFFVFIFVCTFLSSCEFKCSVGNNNSETDTKKDNPVEKGGTLLYNGIHLQSGMVTVDKAYLVANDENGGRIDEGNFVDIRKGVKLILLVKDGWKETGGRVWLGAKMKVTTESGQVMLDKPDMFESYNEEGITTDDSKALGLSVYFTEWQEKEPVSLEVTFRIWDKKGKAYIEGGYTIHTK